MSQVSQHELIDLFEKSNDENSTNELINLKKEICNISQDSVTLKFGTKNKLVLLLKSARDMIKKNKIRLAYQILYSQSDKFRLLSSSSSTYNSASDSEASFAEYYASLKGSLEQLLVKIKKNIHGTIYVNLSVNDFQIIIENINDCVIPVCLLKCPYGDRIKLYLKNRRFQLSNFEKHLKVVNNKSASLTNNQSQESVDLAPESVDEIDSHGQLLRSEVSQSVDQNNPNNYENNDTNNNNKSKLVTITKT